jgi:predicted dehydrogenase
MEKVRLGMIGCGMGASCLYGPYFKYLENGECVAVMDIDPARAREIQILTGCPKVYTQLEPMLEDKDIDAVMILTPTNLHVQQVELAAQAGKHVYCEKPMARTIEEADRMIDACAHNKVKLQVAFMKRFNPSFLRAKEIIDSGRLGEVFEMRAVWDNARARTSAKENYRHRLRSGGGFLQEDGSHPIDVCRWWMGDVAEVSAEVMLVAANRFENEDVGMVAMKHKNGTLSSLHITMLTHRTGMESYEVFGTKGTLYVRWLFHSTHSIEPAVIELHEHAEHVTDLSLSTSWRVEDELKMRWQYLNELRHFCDCVINDKFPSPDGADGRAVVEIINAAYTSALEDRKVKLPLQMSPDYEGLFTSLRAQSRWQISDQDAWWSRY